MPLSRVLGVGSMIRALVVSVGLLLFFGKANATTFNCEFGSMGGGSVGMPSNLQVPGTLSARAHARSKHYERIGKLSTFVYDGSTLLQRGEIEVFHRYKNVFERDRVLFAVDRNQSKILHVLIDLDLLTVHGGVSDGDSYLRYKGKCERYDT